jgi:hypothetical protein
MIQDAISEIEAKIREAQSLSGEKRDELLRLLATLKTEVSGLSEADAERARSIAGFAEVSVHEAMREEKHPKLLNLSIKGLSTSVEGFENSHPKLVEIVNSICVSLSSFGI